MNKILLGIFFVLLQGPVFADGDMFLNRADAEEYFRALPKDKVVQAEAAEKIIDNSQNEDAYIGLLYTSILGDVKYPTSELVFKANKIITDKFNQAIFNKHHLLKVGNDFLKWAAVSKNLAKIIINNPEFFEEQTGEFIDGDEYKQQIASKYIGLYYCGAVSADDLKIILKGLIGLINQEELKNGISSRYHGIFHKNP